MFFRRAWRPVGLYFPQLCAGLLCAAALCVLPGKSLAEEYGESLLDIAPADMMRKEVPFTDAEVLRYLDDYGAAKRMSDTEAEKFFKDRGWSDQRLIYLTVKIALGLESLQNGPSSSLLKNVPKELLPTKAERKIIEKHRPEIETVMMQEH